MKSQNQVFSNESSMYGLGENLIFTFLKTLLPCRGKKNQNIHNVGPQGKFFREK